MHSPQQSWVTLQYLTVPEQHSTEGKSPEQSAALPGKTQTGLILSSNILPPFLERWLQPVLFVLCTTGNKKTCQDSNGKMGVSVSHYFQLCCTARPASGHLKAVLAALGLRLQVGAAGRAQVLQLPARTQYNVTEGTENWLETLLVDKSLFCPEWTTPFWLAEGSASVVRVQMSQSLSWNTPQSIFCLSTLHWKWRLTGPRWCLSAAPLCLNAETGFFYAR